MINELSLQINLTRDRLHLMETQRSTLVDAQRNLKPQPYNPNWASKTPQWFKDMVHETYRDKQPRLPGF